MSCHAQRGGVAVTHIDWRYPEYRDPFTILFTKGERGTGSGDIEKQTYDGVILPKAAPCISLNLHGGSQSRDLYITAICGVVLQLGVLVFAGASVYHPTFKLRFTKDSEPVAKFVYPLMATGTVALVVGMLMCSAVIERSTKEMEWVKNGEGELRARVLWLQRSHVVSDQTFDSCIIFAKDPREKILTSHRTGDDEYVSDDPSRSAAAPWGSLPSSRLGLFGPLRSWVNAISKEMASTPAEAFTLAGIFFSLVGFVLQFQGLRGMNWATSVAHLVAISVMTFLRAWIRRGLMGRPIPKKVLDGHEMDWLALWIARCRKSGDTNFWPTEVDDTLDGRPPDGARDSVNKGNDSWNGLGPLLNWEFATSYPNTAYRGVWGEVESCAGEDALKIRQRLGMLTSWVGMTSRPSTAVASAIEEVMNRLFSYPEENVFCWFMEVRVDHESPAKIHFEARYETGRWRTNAAVIDSALSLWLFSIRNKETQDKEARGKEPGLGNGPDHDWLREDADLKQEYFRILGPDSKNLRRDNRWWIPNGVTEPLYPLDDAYGNDRFHLGFAGLEENLGRLRMVSETPLESALAQHMFSAFMWAISAERIDLKGDTTVVNPNAFVLDSVAPLDTLQLENKTLLELVNSVQRTGLGSLDEVYMCIIPPLSCSKSLPIDAVIEFIRRETADHELRGRWDRIAPIYVELFHICQTFGTENPSFHKVTAILIYIFGTVSNLLDQRTKERRKEDTQRWTHVKEWLSNELKPHGDLLRQFELLYRSQKRLQPDTWRQLSPGAIECGDNNEAHRFFNQLWVPMGVISSQKLSTTDDNCAYVSDIVGWSTLHYAAVYRSDRAILEFIKAGADPNAIDITGRTPLLYAIECIEGGPDNQPDEERSVASSGSVWNREAAVLALLQGGADIDIRGRDGMGPLHFAAKVGDARVGDLLLDAGANSEIYDSSRKTPMLLAALAGFTDLVGSLQLKWANVAARDDGGRTALHLAAMSGNEETVNLILTFNRVDVFAKDRDQQTALHLAAGIGHTGVVRRLLNEIKARIDSEPDIVKQAALRDAGIEASDIDTRTALHYAAEAGHAAVVKSLLDEGIPVDHLDSGERTALHLAAGNGYHEVVRLLLDNGASKDIVSGEGYSALHRVAAGGDRCGGRPDPAGSGGEAVMELLLEHGASLEAGESAGRTALHVAAGKGYEVGVRRLLERGANIDALYGGGVTALHEAAERGHEAVVRLLLESGASVEMADSNGRTALHSAAAHRCESVIPLLLERGARIDAADNDGSTALHLAAETGGNVVVRVLLENGANIDAVDDRRRTALYRAVENCFDETVRLLLGKGATIDIPDTDGSTALHIAAANSNELSEVVARLLIERGACIEAVDANGCNALHCAAANGGLALVRLLLEKGANVDATDTDEGTALHHAVEDDSEAAYEVAELLLENGATIDATDCDGCTPLHLVRGRNAKVMLRLLIEKGANINATDSDFCTALHLVAGDSNGNEDAEAIAEMLLKQGASIDAKDNEGCTALHLAAENGGEAVVRKLLAYGSRTDIVNNEGRTALQLAEEGDYSTVIDLLQ